MYRDKTHEELREEIRRHKRHIASLEAHCAGLERQRDAAVQDREKFRAHFGRRLKWYIELLGKNKYPTMEGLVENEAKFAQTVEFFTW